MYLHINCETSNCMEDHGIMIFDIRIMDFIPMTIEEIKAGLYLESYDKEDNELEDLDDEDLIDLYCESYLCPSPPLTEDLHEVGNIRIIKQKCNTYSYSWILSQADCVGQNLLDIASYFFAPCCNDTTGDEVASAVRLPGISPLGENRDNQIRGLIGAYLKDNVDDILWENTLAYSMMENGEQIDNIWYIDDIYVKPEFRGNRYGINATALFLHKMIGHEPYQLVASHPSPMHDLFHGLYCERPEEGRDFALKYLCKIFKGKPNYDPDVNILWNYYYEVPKNFWQNKNFCE